MDGSAKPTRIGIAVVERNDCFLIGQRPPDSVLGGLWEFPGGKVHSAETPAQCAQRECLEETGIAVEVIGTFGRRDYKYQHGPVELHFLACRPLNAVAEPHPPFRWVPRGELLRFEFPPANADLLRLLVGGDVAFQRS